jgi:hypothetical protein
MESESPNVDDRGTLRFMVVDKTGTMYIFEREPWSPLLFVTIKDEHGHAVEKRLIDITKIENMHIVEMYNDYLMENIDGK